MSIVEVVNPLHVKLGELIRTVTVRLLEEDLIDMVAKACPLNGGPFSRSEFNFDLSSSQTHRIKTDTKIGFFFWTVWPGGKLILFWVKNFGPCSALKL